MGLENELRAEREQRQNLQKSLQREQDNSIELRTQLQQLQGLHTVSGTHTQPPELVPDILAIEEHPSVFFDQMRCGSYLVFSCF